METLLIEVKNPKGIALLRDLEELDIIRVIRNEEAPLDIFKQKRSELFAGKLPLAEGEILKKHIQESRNEWERNI